MNWLYVIVQQIAIYAIASVGLCWLLRHHGVPSLMQASLMGLGCYSFIYSRSESQSVLSSFSISVLLTSAVAGSVGIMVRRMRPEGACFVTLGIGYILWTIYTYWDAFTGGPQGRAAPREILGIDRESSLTVALCLATLLTYVIFYLLWQGGLAKKVILFHESPRLACTLGVDSRVCVPVSYCVAGASAGIAGALIGPTIRFVEPNMFSPTQSFTILTMAVIGGSSRIWFSSIGAALVIGMPEAFRLFGTPSQYSPYLAQMGVATCLVYAVLSRRMDLSEQLAVARSERGGD